MTPRSLTHLPRVATRVSRFSVRLRLTSLQAQDLPYHRRNTQTPREEKIMDCRNASEIAMAEPTRGVEGVAPMIWQIGEWLADPSDDTLSREGVTVKIEPRVMQLLVCLAECAPRVVSIQQLLDEVWGGVIVGSASVYQSISQLRKVLDDTDSAPRYIDTVARKGYRLVAAARRVPVASARGASDCAIPAAMSCWPWFIVVFVSEAANE